MHFDHVHIPLTYLSSQSHSAILAPPVSYLCIIRTEDLQRQKQNLLWPMVSERSFPLGQNIIVAGLYGRKASLYNR